MHGDVFVFILLVVVGFAAFFFSVIYMFCRFIAWIGRGVFGSSRRGPASQTDWACPPVRRARRRVCPNERCRNVEYRDASYCSQCGAALR